jgi:microcystin-dependent protein
MAVNQYLCELKIFAFNYAPKDWAMCNGQFLPINTNQALFSLLGTTYGGNGQTTFALPDMRGKVPVHFGNGFNLGQLAGQAAHTVTLNEMPAHNHFVNASTNTADQQYAPNNLWADGGTAAGFSATNNVAMDAGSVSNVGGSQPHNNMQPYTVLTICIALIGIFPSRA